jgi:hypothetical protein
MKAIKKNEKFILVDNESLQNVDQELVDQIIKAINRIEDYLGLKKTEFRRNN